MNLTLLILALIQVESRGDAKAIGDNGLAWGCLQQHEVFVRDVNRIYGTHFTHKDSLDPVKAVKMATLYLQHYGSESRLGHVASDEELARMFNGGPNGHKKSATLKYWDKVERELEAMANWVAK